MVCKTLDLHDGALHGGITTICKGALSYDWLGQCRKLEDILSQSSELSPYRITLSSTRKHISWMLLLQQHTKQSERLTQQGKLP